MDNKKSRKPSLFSETKDMGQKKTGVLAGIETGVENNTSATSKVLLLLAIIPIIVWLSYLAISKTTAPETYSGTILTTDNDVETKTPQQAPLSLEDELIVAHASQNEGNAKIIDEPSPEIVKNNDSNMVTTAFDALETKPEEAKESETLKVTPKTKPIAKQTKTNHKKTSSRKQTVEKTEAEAGDIAVLQALLEYKKVPTKSENKLQENQSKTAQSLISINEETDNVQQAEPQQVALAPSTTSSTAPTPQQALLSNGLNNQELAETAGANNNSTMLDSTKALIKKCDEIDELDAAICKWDVCDQYGGDESICSKAFTKKKTEEKTGFRLLKYLGLD